MDDTECEVRGVDLHDGTDGPQMSMEEAQISLATLESAIYSGNVEMAVKMAEKLASMQAAVCAITDSRSCKTAEHCIRITIHIEDQIQSRGTVVWLVQPSVSIRALKWKMFEKFEHPPHIQKWIIGGHVAADTTTLSENGITTDGTVFLYLRYHQTPYSADHTSTGVFTSQQSVYSSTTPVAESVSFNGALQTTPACVPVTLQSQTAPVHASQMAHSTVMKTSRNQHQVVGWSCPTCTLINEPTRPGCEICATARPVDYNIPLGYQPSERECKRLEEERKLEELMAAHQSRREDSLLENFGAALGFGERYTSQPHEITDEELATELQMQEQLLARRY